MTRLRLWLARLLLPRGWFLCTDPKAGDPPMRLVTDHDGTRLFVRGVRVLDTRPARQA